MPKKTVDNDANPSPLPELLTPLEVAGILKLNVKTVQRLIKQGRIPARPVAGGEIRKKYRVSRDDLQAYLDGRVTVKVKPVAKAIDYSEELNYIKSRGWLR